MNRRRGSGSRPRTERRGRPAGPPTTRLEVLPGQDFCRSRRSDAAAAKWRRRMTTKTWTAVTAATTVRVCLPPRPPGPIIQSPPGHGDHTIRLSLNCGPEKRQGNRRRTIYERSSAKPTHTRLRSSIHNGCSMHLALQTASSYTQIAAAEAGSGRRQRAAVTAAAAARCAIRHQRRYAN